MIDILLADDQVLFVNSLKDVIQMKAPDLHVVGVVYSGEEAIRFVRSHPRLDVAILDVRMQPIDGLEAMKVIHKEFPDVKIIMLTTFADDGYLRGALEHGACGYVLKDMLPQSFISAIRVVSEGQKYLSPLVIDSMFRKKQADKPVWFAELTEKERRVLELLSLGWNNDEIALEANLGKQTVRNYVHEIYAKMGVRDRMQAMRACIESRLFE
jgi:DNA-binding NarL/FixJ family response regulator